MNSVAPLEQSDCCRAGAAGAARCPPPSAAQVSSPRWDRGGCLRRCASARPAPPCEARGDHAGLGGTVELVHRRGPASALPPAPRVPRVKRHRRAQHARQRRAAAAPCADAGPADAHGVVTSHLARAGIAASAAAMSAGSSGRPEWSAAYRLQRHHDHGGLEAVDVLRRHGTEHHATARFSDPGGLPEAHVPHPPAQPPGARMRLRPTRCCRR